MNKLTLKKKIVFSANLIDKSKLHVFAKNLTKPKNSLKQ